MSKKPNVIVLITHDTGRRLSPYGVTTVDTPNCERLAAQCVQFDNAFCTAPQCSPSRAALFTGRFPHANGVLGLAHADYAWKLHATERPAAMLFGPAGYQTWLIGWPHETHDPRTLGFDKTDFESPSILDLPPKLDGLLAGRDTGRPFFCEICCFETHRPWAWQGTPPDDRLGIDVPPYLHDGPETRAELAGLQGLAKRFDKGLGEILDVMDNRGVGGETIFLATTDHGIAMPLAKGTLRDPGLETFLFIRDPWAALPSGTRRSELISNVDILPTLLEACGIEPPANLHGRSFLPLLRGGDYRPNECIFAEKTFHDCYDPMRGVRTDRYKYIRYFEKSSRVRVPGDVLDQGAYRELAPRAFVRRSQAELFDLQADPNETNNVAGDEKYADVVKDLRRRLADWMRRTNDPLLDGPIASPYYHASIAALLGEDG